MGCNHPLVAALAGYLLDAALDGDVRLPPAARSAAVRSGMVSRRTTLLLLRIRFLLRERSSVPTLAEECVVCGFRGGPGGLEWLSEEEAFRLLAEARPAANVLPAERQQWLGEAVEWAGDLSADLERVAWERAERLRQSHQRVRSITGKGQLIVEPQLPPDLLGIYVLMPVPGGVQG